jgi:hypothetical protein
VRGIKKQPNETTNRKERRERRERSAGCPNPQHSRTQSIVEFRRELLPSEISNLKSEIPDFVLFLPAIALAQAGVIFAVTIKKQK